jgi:hypothetical protein
MDEMDSAMPFRSHDIRALRVSSAERHFVSVTLPFEGLRVIDTVCVKASQQDGTWAKMTCSALALAIAKTPIFAATTLTGLSR